MTAIRSTVLLLALVLLLLPAGLATALTEPETGREVPDTVALGPATLDVTGVGIREKTFLSVNVYLIASYVDAQAEITGDPAAGILELDAPKSLRMLLLRGFGREKLVNAFREVIEKNYDDLAPIRDAMTTFDAYWDRDAREGDVIHFDYVPDTGLTTTLNGEVKGTIAGPAFARALWTVWFGAKPADEGLRRDLVSQLAAGDD